MPKQVAKSTPAKVVTKVRKVDVAGLAKAKRETKMTSKQWKQHQVGMKAKWPQPDYMLEPHPDGKGHTCYRDETFEIITRWMTNTKISYRPHAKAPGTKSHVRYEKYAKAKTVGQALKLGSWPADWCWDYERGFIKVDGPVRDEPLDLSELQEGESSSLSEVDRIVIMWARKEIAKRFGVTEAELLDGKCAGESMLTRAHRIVAQREAKAVLDSGRAVTDNDVANVLMKWGFARNSGRLNVMQEGRSWVWSDTLGLLRDRMGDIHLTTPSHSYPQVPELLNRWLMDRLPEEATGFAWTSLNLNKDYAARIHRDGNNFGPSMISAFGDFSGGQLRYYPEDDGKTDVHELEKQQGDTAEKFDIRQGLALFNGNCAHSVESFKGHRFSVVFFTIGCHRNMKPEDREKMATMGFTVPKPDIDPFQLIAPPSGYGRSAKYRVATPLRNASGAKRAAKKLPGSRYWKKSELKVKPAKVKSSAASKIAKAKGKAKAKAKK